MTNIVARFNANLFSIVSAFVDENFKVKSVEVKPNKDGGVTLCGINHHQLIVIYDENGFAVDPIYVRMDKYNDAICQKNKTAFVEIHEGNASAFIVDNGSRIGIQTDAIKDAWKIAWGDDVIKAMVYSSPEASQINGNYLHDFTQAAERLTGKPYLIMSTNGAQAISIRFEDYPEAIGLLMPEGMTNKGFGTTILPSL